MTQTRMTTRIPSALAEALAARAEANHRSVNGELCAILQAALSGTPGLRRCKLCTVILDNPLDPVGTRDCGGDCLRCMASCGDTDAIRELQDAAVMAR